MLLCASLALLVFLLARFRWRGRLPGPLAATLVAATVSLPLVQLVPLPPALWTGLPGREPIRAGFELLGGSLPWLPLSMDPAATFDFLLALLPPAALVLLAGRATSPPTVGPAITLLALASISLFMGLMQVSQGPQSPLYFHAFTNRDSAVGFFANANHFGTLLLVTLPTAVALLAAAPPHHPAARWRGAIFALHLLVVAAGILLARSAAGLFLLLPTAAASLALIVAGPRLRLLALVGLAPALALYAFLGTGFSTSLGSSPVDRLGMARITATAVADTFPVGAGLGAFPSAYRLHEDLADPPRTYANHAHNDWLELLLDAGLPGLVLMVLVLAWAGRATYAAWRARQPWPRAASVIVWIVLVHGLVDYPIRTPAIALVFAWAAVVLTLRSDGPDKAVIRARPEHSG